MASRLRVPGSMTPFVLRVNRRAAICFALAIVGGLPARAADDLADRRQQIANMTLAEQQQLLRSQQRFDELTAADQNRMRKLDADLRTDPQRARLQQVLDRYYEWLKTLSPEQRAELEDLNSEARVMRIRELMAREREEHSRRRPRFGGEPLPKEDLRAIYAWFGDLVWRHRQELLAGLPESRRAQVEKLDESMLRKSLLFTAIQRSRGDQLPIETTDYERLLKELSPETRDKLARAPSPQHKKRLAREWLGQAIMAHMGPHSMRRAMAGISGDELQRYFEQLPEPDRKRLMGMPPEKMQEELKHLYMQRSSRPDGPPQPFDRPDGPPPPFDRPGGPPRLFDRPPFGPTFGPPKHGDGRRGGVGEGRRGDAVKAEG